MVESTASISESVISGSESGMKLSSTPSIATSSAWSALLHDGEFGHEITFLSASTMPLARIGSAVICKAMIGAVDEMDFKSRIAAKRLFSHVGGVALCPGQMRKSATQLREDARVDIGSGKHPIDLHQLVRG